MSELPTADVPLVAPPTSAFPGFSLDVGRVRQLGRIGPLIQEATAAQNKWLARCDAAIQSLADRDCVFGLAARDAYVVLAYTQKAGNLSWAYSLTAAHSKIWPGVKTFYGLRCFAEFQRSVLSIFTSHEHVDAFAEWSCFEIDLGTIIQSAWPLLEPEFTFETQDAEADWLANAQQLAATLWEFEQLESRPHCSDAVLDKQQMTVAHIWRDARNLATEFDVPLIGPQPSITCTEDADRALDDVLIWCKKHESLDSGSPNLPSRLYAVPQIRFGQIVASASDLHRATLEFIAATSVVEDCLLGSIHGPREFADGRHVVAFAACFARLNEARQRVEVFQGNSSGVKFLGRPWPTYHEAAFQLCAERFAALYNLTSKRNRYPAEDLIQEEPAREFAAEVTAQIAAIRLRWPLPRLGVEELEQHVRQEFVAVRAPDENGRLSPAADRSGQVGRPLAVAYMTNGREPLHASRCVQLFGPDEAPIVNGIRKGMLTLAEYDTVQALIEAGRRLSMEELDELSGHPEARKVMAKLAEDSDWKSVLLFSGKRRLGYGIL